MAHDTAGPIVLALPGPQYTHNLAEGELRIAGKPLKVFAEGSQGRGTAWDIWDGAICLALYLERVAEQLKAALGPADRRRVLELGSGTGVAGIAAAMALGVPTVLTDLGEALPALEKNVALNPSAAPLLRVEELDWCQLTGVSDTLGGPFGLVIAADCVWLEHLVAPLVAALEALVDGRTKAIIAYQSRSARVDELLFGLLDRCFERVALPPAPGEPPRGVIDLYALHRKDGSTML